MKKLRVAAVEGRSVPIVAEGGGTLVVNGRRFVGRAADGSALPQGEEVPWHLDYVRAINRGDLELLERGGEE